MINAPANDGQDWGVLRKWAKEAILAKIARVLGVDLAPLIEVEEVLDPVIMEAKTSSDRGALYGSSSNSALSAFLRHPNRGLLENLYHCGGSAHPGGGIPLCLLSGQIVGKSAPDASA